MITSLWRSQLLARQGYRCAWCRRPAARTVIASRRLPAYWFDEQARRWRDGQGNLTRLVRHLLSGVERVHVELSIAFLNHDDEDTRPENSAALCQHCSRRHEQSGFYTRSQIQQHREEVNHSEQDAPLENYDLSCELSESDLRDYTVIRFEEPSSTANESG